MKPRPGGPQPKTSTEEERARALLLGALLRLDWTPGTAKDAMEMLVAFDGNLHTWANREMVRDLATIFDDLEAQFGTPPDGVR